MSCGGVCGGVEGARALRAAHDVQGVDAVGGADDQTVADTVKHLEYQHRAGALIGQPYLRGKRVAGADGVADLVAAAVRPGDAILVKGSLGSRMKLVVLALDRLAEAG